MSAIQRSLLAPDVVVPCDAEPTPLGLAASAGVGLTGAAVFFGIVGLSLASSSSVFSALNLALVPPLAALLSFPPLYLLTSMRGRFPGLLRLAGVGLSGPAVAGTWLGACAPLVLLFALTGEVDAAFGLLGGLCVLAAIGAGGRAVLQNRKRAGSQAPGRLISLAHYAFTLWTAAVLSIQLV